MKGSHTCVKSQIDIDVHANIQAIESLPQPFTGFDNFAYSICREPNERLMGFFTAYFDASGHPADQPFVIVAGYVANYTQWRMFNAMWENEHEKAKCDLPFHMTDFMAARRAAQKSGTAKRQDYLRMTDLEASSFIMHLANWQQAYMALGVTCIVEMSEYQEVETVLDLRTIVPPYALAARVCTDRIDRWRHEHTILEPVECIFEDGDFERGKFIDLMRIEGMPAPIFKGKNEFPGLQAADYLAGQMNTQVKLEKDGKGKPPGLLLQRLMAIPHIYIKPTKHELIKLCETKNIMPKIVKPPDGLILS
jgi:uncharacterized protein DUF3800